MPIDLNAVEYATVYTGANGSGACTCNCPCCSQKGRDARYQGRIEQAIELFKFLPNLRQLYILGNPDPSVDAEFCNYVMKEAVTRGIHVCTSTSCVGGKRILRRLLEGISPNMVDYISLSFDAITEPEMSLLKGIKYPMERALKGMDWALSNGYTVKVQPTLWSYNYQNVRRIIEFFYEKGIRWFSFHIGSLEAGVHIATHEHLTPEQVMCVHQQIEEELKEHNDLKVRCPIIYLQCGENDKNKWYCTRPESCKEVLIILERNGIRVTHAPIASCFYNCLTFMLGETKELPTLDATSGFCPLSEELSGRTDTICRYVSKTWNY